MVLYGTVNSCCTALAPTFSHNLMLAPGEPFVARQSGESGPAWYDSRRNGPVQSPVVTQPRTSAVVPVRNRRTFCFWKSVLLSCRVGSSSASPPAGPYSSR